MVNPGEKGNIMLFENIKVLWGLDTSVLQVMFIEENQWVCLRFLETCFILRTVPFHGHSLLI